MITKCTGKPITMAREEITSSLFSTRQYLNLFSELQENAIEGIDKWGVERIKGRGTSMILTGWKNPVMRAMAYVVPNFLLGNISLLKASKSTGIVSEIIEEIFDEAGFKNSVISLNMDPPEIEEFVNRFNVDRVLYQGSKRSINLFSSNVDFSLKSQRYFDVAHNSFAVIEDWSEENQQKIVDTIVEGAFYNSGESEYSLKQAFIKKENLDSFLQLLNDSMDRKIVGGNPLEPENTLGAISSKDTMKFAKDLVALSNGGRRGLFEGSNNSNGWRVRTGQRGASVYLRADGGAAGG